MRKIKKLTYYILYTNNINQHFSILVKHKLNKFYPKIYRSIHKIENLFYFFSHKL